MGWVGAVAALQQYRDAKKNIPTRIDPTKALEMATAELKPGWDNTLQGTLKQLQRNAVGRGVWGQLPTDVLERSTAANIEGQKNAAIAGLSRGIQAQNSQEITSAQNAASNALNSFLGQLGGVGSSLSNYSLKLPGSGNKKQKEQSVDYNKYSLKPTKYQYA